MIRSIASLVIALPLLAACASGASETVSSGSQETEKPAHNESLFAAHHSIEMMGSAFFQMMDGDGNGIVTALERAKAPHKEWMVDFSLIDLNGDAELTKAEYLEALRRAHPSLVDRET